MGARGSATLAGALLTGLLSGVGCDAVGPLGPLAGGRLRGELVEQPVDDWSFADAHESFAVETRPADPYSVTTWGVTSGGDFYVPTREPLEKAWVRYALADPRVRLRVGDRIYERRAVRVTDPEEFRQVIGLLLAKYDLDPPSEQDVDEVWLLRLDPR